MISAKKRKTNEAETTHFATTCETTSYHRRVSTLVRIHVADDHVLFTHHKKGHILALLARNNIFLDGADRSW